MSTDERHAEFDINFIEKYEKTIAKAVNNCLVANLGQGISAASFERTVTRSLIQ